MEDPPPEREDTVQHLYHRGLSLLQNRSYEKAEVVFGKVLEKAPGFVLALYCRGACRLALGGYPEALGDFDAFIRVRPGSAKAIALRGRTYLALERYAEAELDLQKALEIMPGQRGWIWDLDQAKMLKRGNETAGVGKVFPKLALQAAHKQGDGARWEVSGGRLVPLLSASSRIEKTLCGGPGYRGLLLLCVPRADHPLDLARLSELSEYLTDIQKRGLTVVTVFPSPPEALWKLKDGKELSFPLFSDPNGKAAWQLGVLDVRFREQGQPLPTLFFIDDKGVIRIRRTFLDPGRRTPLEKVLQEIDRLCKKETPPGEEKEKKPGK